jgi:hypothetical protein
MVASLLITLLLFTIDLMIYFVCSLIIIAKRLCKCILLLYRIVEVSFMHAELGGNCGEDVWVGLAWEPGCVVDHRQISQALSPQFDASHTL